MHKWGLGLTGLVSGAVSILSSYLFLPLVFFLSSNENSETIYSLILLFIFPGVIYLVSILIYLQITGLSKTFSNKKLLFSLHILFAHIVLALFYISAGFFYLPLTALLGKYFGSSSAYLPLLISIIVGLISYILWGFFIIKSFQKLISRETYKFSNWLILVAGLSIILGAYLPARFLQNIFKFSESAFFPRWLIPYAVMSFVLGWAIDKVRNRTSL